MAASLIINFYQFEHLRASKEQIRESYELQNNHVNNYLFRALRSAQYVQSNWNKMNDSRRALLMENVSENLSLAQETMQLTMQDDRYYELGPLYQLFYLFQFYHSNVDDFASYYGGNSNLHFTKDNWDNVTNDLNILFISFTEEKLNRLNWMSFGSYWYETVKPKLKNQDAVNYFHTFVGPEKSRKS